jgi:hypothetical protein
LVVADVSEQHISPILNGQAVKEECWEQMSASCIGKDVGGDWFSANSEMNQLD